MSIGNKIGFEFEKDLDLFKPMYGTFVLEIDGEAESPKLEVLGTTLDKEEISINNVKLDLNELIRLWEEPLEKVFPTRVNTNKEKPENVLSDKKCMVSSGTKFAKPRVFIPVFPGTNCEYDLAKAFIDAGGDPRVEVFRNLKANDIEDSINAFAKQIEEAQIIMIPGGFSAGDEPDGSRKIYCISI